MSAIGRLNGYDPFGGIAERRVTEGSDGPYLDMGLMVLEETCNLSGLRGRFEQVIGHCAKAGAYGKSMHNE